MSSATARPSPVTPRHLFLLALALFLPLCFALTALYSHHRLLWSDEILAAVLVTDPSFSHMLQAWRAGADGGGLSFYLLARLWAHLFGTSALALRLFSSAGVALGCAALVRLLTPFVRLPLALFTTLFVCFSSDVLLWQLMQFRFYGMLFGLTAVATLLAVLPADHPRRLALLTFLTHTLLTSTHPFGLVYSAALLAATALASLREPHPTRALLTRTLPALLGWWTLPLSATALRASAAIGKPHFWTTRPHLPYLLHVLTAYSLPAGAVLAVCSAAALFVLVSTRPRPSLVPSVAGATRLRIALLALFAVPLLVFLGSQGSSSLFVNRYLVPTDIAVTLLLALELHLLAQAVLARRLRPAIRRAVTILPAAALLLVAAFMAVVRYPRSASYPSLSRRPLIRALEHNLPRNLPVVIENAELFPDVVFFRADPRFHPTDVLDWDTVMAPTAQRGEVTGYHLMQQWQRLGYFPGSVQDSAPFLAATPRFYVLDDPGVFWFERNLAHNPAWQLTALPSPAPSEPSLHLWLVCRRDTDTPCTPGA